MPSSNEKIINSASMPISCSSSQTSKVRDEHWLHIVSITSNYNFESMPTKHRVAILNFYFYILCLQGCKGRNVI